MPACDGMASGGCALSVTGSDPCDKYPKHGKDSEMEGVAFPVGFAFSVGSMLSVRVASLIVFVMSLVGRNLPTIVCLLYRHA